MNLAAPEPAAGDRTILSPFDIVEPIEPRRAIRRVTVRRWRRACRRLFADSGPPGGLRTACAAAIDLLAHQLQPALAVLRGDACRLLLADDVGLGKTIQAALVAAELRARGWADRILVLTPAGIRDQWAGELRERVAIEATVADAVEMRRLAATLPAGLNPWAAAPVAVASIDYVKRPEVLPAVRACRWDVVIVDEAHHVAGDTDRYAAAAALARAAACAVLITATPHSGDRRAYAALCGLGSVDDDALLVFRRSRRDVGLPGRRRVCRLQIRMCDNESAMHRVLDRFAQIVTRERGDAAALALSVLRKRAGSSARSLALSVDRRLAAIDRADRPEVDLPVQFSLPLDDESGEFSGDDLPPAWSETLMLGDRRVERTCLRDLRDAARRAAEHESKVQALRRLLLRVAEPAVVFTEYRDTLVHVAERLNIPALIIHGGLDRHERLAVLQRFRAGDCRVLLATDAAGEGLNLQHACRLVINFELPWNPMRLEQRIGRVDRIGQQRTVHVIHLLVRHPAETALLRRLTERVAAAREEIGAPDPVDGHEPRAPSVPPGQPAADLHRLAEAEVHRLAFWRRLNTGRGSPVAGEALVARTRRARTRARLRGSGLFLFSVAQEDPWLRVVASTIVPVAIFRGVAAMNDWERLVPYVQQAAAAWQRDAGRIHGAFIAGRLHRERAALSAPGQSAAPAQSGLFDRRVQRASITASTALSDLLADGRRRIESIEARAATTFSVRLALVLVP